LSHICSSQVSNFFFKSNLENYIYRDQRLKKERDGPGTGQVREQLKIQKDLLRKKISEPDCLCEDGAVFTSMMLNIKSHIET
jgi:hypothetical protein